VKSAESLYVKILMCGILTHGGWVNLCNIWQPPDDDSILSKHM
jgi:hypothetical protein